MDKQPVNIDHIEVLRSELSGVFGDLRSGRIKHHDAAELANIGGKMIASAKVQIEYAALRKETPSIAFLESRNSKK